jgi:hypothetical protein
MSFLSANEILLVFDCKKSNFKIDFYETKSVCHTFPHLNKPIFIINENTNSKTNMEIIYALTENIYVKSNFETGSMKDTNYGYLKLNKSTLNKFNKVFNEIEISKKFVSYHELGHIYFKKKKNSKLEREIFSDIFALSLLGCEVKDIDNYAEILKDFRFNELLEKDGITHYSVFAINLYQDEEQICPEDKILNAKNIASKITEKTKSIDLIKIKLISLIKKDKNKVYILSLANAIYKKKMDVESSKQEAIKTINKFQDISFDDLEKNGIYQFYFKQLLRINN